MNYQQIMMPVKAFLHCETPDAWIDEAKKPQNLTLLLIDHLICELKAAQTAMWLIRKYAVDKMSGDELLTWLAPYEAFVYRREGDLTTLYADVKRLTKTIQVKQDAAYSADLVDKMVLLIKEELHHFYQVLEIMTARGIPYYNITAGRYAKGLMRHVRTHEPATFIDKMICGAYIEARSCERFAKLAPYLDESLRQFYLSLLRSEARHYQDYIELAEQINGSSIWDRIDYFGQVEAQLVLTTDNEFRFHSGIPV